MGWSNDNTQRRQVLVFDGPTVGGMATVESLTNGGEGFDDDELEQDCDVGAAKNEYGEDVTVGCRCRHFVCMLEGAACACLVERGLVEYEYEEAGGELWWAVVRDAGGGLEHKVVAYSDEYGKKLGELLMNRYFEELGGERYLPASTATLGEEVLQAKVGAEGSDAGELDMV